VTGCGAGVGRSQAAMSAGMVQLLTPVVEQCDSRLTSVLQAQTVLLAQIDLFSAGAPCARPCALCRGAVRACATFAACSYAAPLALLLTRPFAARACKGGARWGAVGHRARRLRSQASCLAQEAEKGGIHASGSGIHSCILQHLGSGARGRGR
jgi:hypothetical protein